MKAKYITPLSERVFMGTLMDGLNPGGGNIINRGSGGIQSDHVICVPARYGNEVLV